MEFVKEIRIDFDVVLTCCLMDWLKDNGYPDCDHTHVVFTEAYDSYGGLISTYRPNALFVEDLRKECMSAKKYHDMYRLCDGPDSYIFYMPEVDKYYLLTF